MKAEQRIFALIDINNCYVSCERVFNPIYNNKPVIVLSNNDGCAVARSNEAKAIGIKMGVPLFKIKDIVQEQSVIVLSSNYALYAEMSRRFHSILASFVAPQEQEIYSIDECFLDLTSYAKHYDLIEYCQQMRQRLAKWIGLPVSIGIGHSKTEAKIANHIGKKLPQFNGVCDLVRMDLNDKELMLSAIDVSEVWGVGRKHSKRLMEMGIETVFDLAISDPHKMKKLFSVVMARTVMELKGISCIEIEHTPEDKKQIVSSRSFGQRVTQKEDLKEALGKYAQDAFHRLRDQDLLCGCIMAFIESNPFDQNEPFYKKVGTYTFPEPTDNVLELVKAATTMVEHIFKPGVKYKKCGVILTGLEPKSSHIYDLLTDMQEIQKKDRLMDAFEQVQKRFGKTKLGVGSSNFTNRNWSMSRNKLTQNYFNWDELLTIVD